MTLDESYKKIGSGSLSTVYIKDDKVIKLFNKSDIIWTNYKEKLSELTNVDSDIFVFPKKLLIENDNLIGYEMEYISGCPLYNIIKTLSFDDIKLLEKNAEIDIKNDFNKRIKSSDMHEYNLMYDEQNKKIRVLDTDFFEIDKRIEPDVLYQMNLLGIRRNLKSMIGSIFLKSIGTYSFNQYDDRISASEYLDLINSELSKKFNKEFNDLYEIESCLKEEKISFEYFMYKQDLKEDFSLNKKIIFNIVNSKKLMNRKFVNKFVSSKINKLNPEEKEIMLDNIYKDLQFISNSSLSNEEKSEKLKEYQGYLNLISLVYNDTKKITR